MISNEIYSIKEKMCYPVFFMQNDFGTKIALILLTRKVDIWQTWSNKYVLLSKNTFLLNFENKNLTLFIAKNSWDQNTKLRHNGRKKYLELAVC